MPVIEGDKYRFAVKIGVAPVGAENGTKEIGRGANFPMHHFRYRNRRGLYQS